MDGNGQKWTATEKITETDQNGQKQTEMDRNKQKRTETERNGPNK